jgi:hypothetical protein
MPYMPQSALPPLAHLLQPGQCLAASISRMAAYVAAGMPPAMMPPGCRALRLDRYFEVAIQPI